MEKQKLTSHAGKVGRILGLASLCALVISCYMFKPKTSPVNTPSTTLTKSAQPGIPTPKMSFPNTTHPSPLGNPIQKQNSLSSPTSDQPALFSDANAEKTKPDDVLEQVGYLAGATGFGGWLCNEPSGTLYDLYSDIQGNRILESGIPTVFYICGWKEDEKGDLLIKFPNGATKSTPLAPMLENKTKGVYYVEYRYTVKPEDPLGEYTFVFKGTGREVAVLAEYSKLTSPVLRIVGQNDLYLAGFKPGEQVRIFAYQPTPGQNLQGAKFPLSSFLAWQEFSVDSNGFLHVQTDFDVMLFAAIGLDSGETLAVRKEIPMNVSSIRRDSCEYASFLGDSLLKVEDKAVVAMGENNQVLELYNTPARVPKGSLAMGVVVTLLDGPQCADGYRWWKVTDYRTEGWVKEIGYYYDVYLKPKKE
jgi:hypothetical protein